MPELYIQLDDGTLQPLVGTTGTNLPEISFADTTPAAIEANMIALAEAVLGRTLAPADPVRLILDTLTAIIVQERYNLDYAAQMNLIDYSQPPFLNALGALFETDRLPASSALTTLRVTLSAAQPSVVTIPASTRVSTGSVVFATLANANIPIGDTTIDIAAAAEVAGAAGNGYLAGQIAQMVDILPYVESISNTTTSQGGTDIEGVEAYRARIKASIRSFSTAGPVGAYRYWAQSANSSIVDVAVLSPMDLGTPTVLFGVVPPTDNVTGADGDYYIDTATALLYGPRSNGAWGTGYDIIGARGQVLIYALLDGGELPGSEILAQIEEACSADDRRPLTDQVIAQAPSAAEYDATLTYYIDTADAARELEIKAAIEDAIADYHAWQCAQIGRDINPSELIYRIMAAGAKRVVITAPAYTVLASNQVAQLGTETITYGGLESA
jgi:phage-related baseplate assembly protein